MSINFSGVQSVTIPEGVVTKITDAAGRVLWQAGGNTVVLEVEKITADTYAGETTYTGEQFILLSIYPKTNGTVNITYGGLTKTITDTSGALEPNAQNVFFGTFNGVSDDVTTPSSGTLTIEGDYINFAVGSYSVSSKSNEYCGCITAVTDWGGITNIADNAFNGCTKLYMPVIPEDIVSIGANAFFGGTIKNADYGATIITDQIAMSGSQIILPVSLRELYVFPWRCDCTFATMSDIDDMLYIASLKVLATTPPTLLGYTDGYGVFGYRRDFGGNYLKNKVPIIVPKGCGELYKNADGWKDNADDITEET